jgi:flap endonuclease-1
VDAAILVGTDFFEGIKGIGPKTAVKRLREWGSLDHAPAEVRERLPLNLDEIRLFFLSPPVVEQVDLRRRRPDEMALHRFLCESREFTHGRVESAVARLRSTRGQQVSLDEGRWG